MNARAPLPPPPSLASLMAAGPVALFVDFDGTLVDLAETPDGIVVPETLNLSLCGLQHRLDGRLAIVTGRALDDLEGHLGPCEIARAGSHGAYRIAANGERLGDAPRELPAAVIGAMQDYAEKYALLYEAKPHGAALHYRADPVKEGATVGFAQGLGDAARSGDQDRQMRGRTGSARRNKAGAVEAFCAIARFAAQCRYSSGTT